LGDAMVIADLTKAGRQNTLSGSHVAARRPSLYGMIAARTKELNSRKLRNRMSGEKII
jgi:hypothetical protein